ncbi:unnamed protein product [Darwinula stevensoni]|uniref:Poly [ADP-ribose] polymerase n=1 Tax=Darwinula stevensoni TaxID=69355 RepID=A0A7R9FNU7_9CRUS|nr:unnamed protein product [Darwinula stevensoni]CAG0896860.1 unnamed protein product [Darwinula stevensoni]
MHHMCKEAIHEPHAYMKKKVKEENAIPIQPKRTLEEVLRDKKERKEAIPDLVCSEKLRLSTDNSIWERMEQLEILIDIFPECERSYLRRKCDECNGCATTLMAHPRFPSHWEPMPLDKLVTMIALDESSDEYKTGYLSRKLEFHRIERVQNPYLWEMYQNRWELFVKRHGDRDLLNETYPYHGTIRKKVQDFCASNLGWRYHESSGGQTYGQGTYLS